MEVGGVVDGALDLDRVCDFEPRFVGGGWMCDFHHAGYGAVDEDFVVVFAVAEAVGVLDGGEGYGCMHAFGGRGGGGGGGVGGVEG